jgi:hypothetical protein
MRMGDRGIEIGLIAQKEEGDNQGKSPHLSVL